VYCVKGEGELLGATGLGEILRRVDFFIYFFKFLKMFLLFGDGNLIYYSFPVGFSPHPSPSPPPRVARLLSCLRLKVTLLLAFHVAP